MGIENMNLNNNEQAESTEVKKNRLLEWIKRNPPVRNLMIGAAAIGTFLAFSGEGKAGEKPDATPVDSLKNNTELVSDSSSVGQDADAMRIRTEAKLDASNEVASVGKEEKGVEITKSLASPVAYDSHRNVVDIDLSGNEVEIKTYRADGSFVESRKMKDHGTIFYEPGYTHRIFDAKTGQALENLSLDADKLKDLASKKDKSVEEQKKDMEQNLKQQINQIDQEKGNQ